MGHGAVDFVVIEFAGSRPDSSLAAALRTQVDKGVISIIDMLFVEKRADGSVRHFELDQFVDSGNDTAAPRVAQSIDGLISPQDASDVASALPPGTTALIILFEHVWLRDLREAIETSGGRLAAIERIPGEVIDAVEQAAHAAG